MEPQTTGSPTTLTSERIAKLQTLKEQMLRLTAAFGIDQPTESSQLPYAMLADSEIVLQQRIENTLSRDFDELCKSFEQQREKDTAAMAELALYMNGDTLNVRPQPMMATQLTDIYNKIEQHLLEEHQNNIAKEENLGGNKRHSRCNVDTAKNNDAVQIETDQHTAEQKNGEINEHGHEEWTPESDFDFLSDRLFADVVFRRACPSCAGTVGQHADSLALKRLVDADRCGQYRKSSVISFTTVHRGFAVQVALSVPCPLCEQSPADNTAGECAGVRVGCSMELETPTDPKMWERGLTANPAQFVRSVVWTHVAKLMKCKSQFADK